VLLLELIGSAVPIGADVTEAVADVRGGSTADVSKAVADVRGGSTGSRRLSGSSGSGSQAAGVDCTEIGMALLITANTAMQGPPAIPSKPLLHTQSLTALLPVGESELEGQLLQVPDDVAPTVLEYFPLSHRAHDDEPDEPLYLPASIPASKVK